MKCLFCRDDKGATAIEYGLIAALVAVGTIASIGMIGNNLGATFFAIVGSMGGGYYDEGPSPEQIPAFYDQYGGGDAVDRTEMQTILDNECPPEGECPTVDEMFTEYDTNLSDDLDWDEWQIMAYDQDGP